MEICEKNRTLRAKMLGDFIEKCRVSGDADWNSREDLAYVKEVLGAETKVKAAAQAAREEMAGSRSGAAAHQNAEAPAHQGSKAGGAEAAAREAVLFSPGQELVMAGKIGRAGTAFFAKYRREKLLEKLPDAFISLGEKEEFTGAAAWPEELKKYPCWPVHEGGMYRMLNEAAVSIGRGFEIDYCKVPVSQVTIEFCEVFELDPWALLSGGCAMFAAERGNDLIRIFEKAGIPCAVVGTISKDNDKAICHRETRSLLNRPQPDELLRVLKSELKADAAEGEVRGAEETAAVEDIAGGAEAPA